MNESNEWTATVTDLPKHADGTEITYTWTVENVPEGYTITDIEVEGTVTTLTNTLKEVPNPDPDEDRVPEETKPVDPNNPQTGDNSDLFVWFAMLTISAFGILVVFEKKRMVIE